MANALYPRFKQALMSSGFSNVTLDSTDATNGPYITLVSSSTYTYSADHDFYNDLIGIAQTTAGADNVAQITSPTVSTGGVFDGADVTLTAVATGANLGNLICYRSNSSTDSGTWHLVLFQDSSLTNAPVTPNGGDISVTFSSSGIFTL